MEPATTVVVAAAVTKLIADAAKAIGDKLFDRTTDALADQGAGLGRRLVDRLLHRASAAGADAGVDTAAAPSGGEVAFREALNELVVAPEDGDAQAAVRVTVRRLLETDPTLLAEVKALLPAETVTQVTQVTASGERAVAVGRDSTGMIITGDDNQVNRPQ